MDTRESPLITSLKQVYKFFGLISLRYRYLACWKFLNLFLHHQLQDFLYFTPPLGDHIIIHEGFVAENFL